MTRNIIQLQRAARLRQFKRTVILSAFVTILGCLLLGKECFAQSQFTTQQLPINIIGRTMNDNGEVCGENNNYWPIRYNPSTEQITIMPQPTGNHYESLSGTCTALNKRGTAAVVMSYREGFGMPLKQGVFLWFSDNTVRQVAVGESLNALVVDDNDGVFVLSANSAINMPRLNAYYFQSNGQGVEILSSSPGSSTSVIANAKGEAIGSHSSVVGQYFLFKWSPTQGVTSLALPTGATMIYGISNNGLTTGQGTFGSQQQEAFKANSTGISAIISNPVGFDHGVGGQINDCGSILGQFQTLTSNQQFLFDGGVIRTATELSAGGLPIVGLMKINNRGQILVSAQSPEGNSVEEILTPTTPVNCSSTGGSTGGKKGKVLQQ